jgi:hypothetical protein
LKLLSKQIIIVIALFANIEVLAQIPSPEPCRSSKPRSTPSGLISKTECGTAATGYRDTIIVNGIPVLSDTRLYNESTNKERSIVIYSSGASNVETGCASRLYIADYSTAAAKVIAFGVKNACNEFQSVSWGENRSVISIKNNVKFIYENSKITLPLKGKKLYESIEPPHAGAGLSLEDAIPFAEDVPPPT